MGTECNTVIVLFKILLDFLTFFSFFSFFIEKNHFRVSPGLPAIYSKINIIIDNNDNNKVATLGTINTILHVCFIFTWKLVYSSKTTPLKMGQYGIANHIKQFQQV